MAVNGLICAVKKLLTHSLTISEYSKAILAINIVHALIAGYFSFCYFQ